jgi:hypothetical protein
MNNSIEQQDQFDPTTTVSKPDKWLLNQALLNMWFNQLLPAVQKWEEEKLRGNYERELNSLRSIIITFLCSIRSSLDKEFLTKKPEPYNNSRNIIKFLSQTEEEEDIYEILDLMESFLYIKGLTKWDTKESFDRKDVWGSKQRYLG